MAEFDYAIPFVLQHEGGLVDNPHDPGGITNFGITIGFMDCGERCQRYFGHSAPPTRSDIRNLTRPRATEIYLHEIWEPNRYSELEDDRVAAKVFDVGVNMGERRGELFAQQAANRLGADLDEDGQLGSASIAAINELDPEELVTEICRLQRERYEHIVQVHPDRAVFLKGWLVRARWNGS